MQPLAAGGMNMGIVHDSGTRISLLGRLRKDPGDQAAWSELVAHYGGKIHAWCLRWGLQEADSQDVTQDVLLKLAKAMHDFHYDPSRSFRAWLKTLTNHALSDFLESRPRSAQGSGDSQVLDMLHSVEARADLLQRLEAEFDREVLEVAMTRVRLRVEPQTWAAFQLTAIEGLSGAEAGARIPMQVAQVFVAKRRVQKMLQEEVAKLEQEDSPEEGPA
jgi:RNA polymerase sigma factor (sigma-70 family)